MAGMTSQPSMGAIVACAKGTKLDTGKRNAHHPVNNDHVVVLNIYQDLGQWNTTQYMYYCHQIGIC